MDSRLTVEMFSINKSKQLLKDWFIMPKVVLYDKHLFTIGKNYSAFVKQMQNNKFNFILHKFNEYLHLV